MGPNTLWCYIWISILLQMQNKKASLCKEKKGSTIAESGLVGGKSSEKPGKYE